MRVLIVEDDLGVRRLVTIHLEEQGLGVTAASTAAAAMTELHHAAFDVVILDLTLPDGSGLDVLRALRELGSTAHVVIMSGTRGEAERVTALGLGADDYVVKPFFVRELTARILAVQRRHDVAKDSGLRYGSMAIDLHARQVTVDDVPLSLTAKEFDLLAFLAARPGHVFSRDELLRSVWQSAADWQRPSTVTEHMRRLRSKIEPDPLHPRFLHTVRGVGYRFDPTSTLEEDQQDRADRADRAADLADQARATAEGQPGAGDAGTFVLVRGWIVSADDATVAMLGASSEAEMVGREALDFVAPQSLTAARARRDAAASGLWPRSQVLALRRADGVDIYVEISSVPTEWDGMPASLATIRPSTDPSTRLRHLVTGVFSEVSDAVIVTDPQFHVRSWNAAAERLYGWAEQEVVGRHISDAIPAVGPDDELDLATRTLEETGRWFGEARQLARDGSLVSVRSSTTLIRDGAGDRVAVVSVNRPLIVAPTPTPPPSSEARDEADIRRGLDDDEFDVHYQPVVALDDLHVMAVEALVRWNHPARGLLNPGSFIDVAERSGMILELGRAVFGKACRQMAAWRRAGIDLEVAVNLSSRQLVDSALFEDITTTLAESALDPHALWLEVTETALVEDLDQAAEVLHRLAGLGVRVAIDDFGTGWASLTYLKQFPVHALKIDQTFVDGVDHNPQDAAIARSILSLGEELDLIVVAEGVETLVQQSALQTLGCTTAQGFLYGRPTPAATVPLQRAHTLPQR